MSSLDRNAEIAAIKGKLALLEPALDRMHESRRAANKKKIDELKLRLRFLEAQDLEEKTIDEVVGKIAEKYNEVEKQDFTPAWAMRSQQKKQHKNFDGTVFSRTLALGDFEYFCKYVLVIEYRTGMIGTTLKKGPFILASHQKMIIANILETMFVEKRPARKQILKSRQLGNTTLMLALCLWFQLKFGTWNFMLIIDKFPHITTKRLLYISWFEKVELLFGVSIETGGKSSNILQLSNGSKTLFESGQADNPGTGEMLHGLLYSEVPKWNKKTVTAVDASVKPALQETPYTLFVNESTAMGQDAFYASFMRIINGGMPGHEAIFIPWYYSDEYRKEAPVFFDFSNEPEHSDFDPDNVDVVLTEEQMALKYGLSNDRVYWRRQQIDGLFQGNTNLFDQEYPTTYQHAFRSTSVSVFSKKFIDYLSTFDTGVIRCYSIKDASNDSFDENRHWSKITPELTHKAPGSNYVLIREKPSHGKRYFFGVDFAKGELVKSADGNDDLDWTSGVMVDEAGNWVAVFMSQRPSHDVEWVNLIALCKFYNNAIINGELADVGIAIRARVFSTGYPNMFIDHNATSGWSAEDSSWTVISRATRPKLIGRVKRSLYERPERAFNWSRYQCEETPLEHFSMFQRDNTTGKESAAHGFHDDIVFGSIYAEHARIVTLGDVQAKEDEAVVVEEYNPFSFSSMTGLSEELRAMVILDEQPKFYTFEA
jgi:hypothetical protein